MTTRCGVYTRKSTEEGLEQAFNSLDAQREAAEAYIASQRSEGWTVVPDRYDDGGYSGGNVDRPAFQRLMTDVREGRVDAVVIYKIDRLSRSLMDFARIMETLDRHHVALVSVTQQFNTTSSMGRLTLNILLSFAQFEREIISERTRDKISAMRRKGKHWGGHAVLGYDIARDVTGSRLVINPDEAEQVRHIFTLYRDLGGLIPVVHELQRLGWTNKAWTTRAGHPRGGGPIDKGILWRILTNVTYAGKVAHDGQIYEGEHEAIIPPELWSEVQARLARNHRGGSADEESANRNRALLRGLLTCGACGCAMMATYTVRKSPTGARKRYRYYTCLNVAKKGRRACPTPSLPAERIEQFVVQELSALGRDPELRQRVLAEAAQRLAADAPDKRKVRLNQTAATQALDGFEPLWQSLTPAEQHRMMHLLVERVTFDAQRGNVQITFQPTGIATLGQHAPACDPESHATPGHHPTPEEAAA